MELKESEKERIVGFLRREGAEEVSVFGSYARGNADTESDVDILVEFEDRKSLVDISRMERKLAEELGREIDLVTENSLHPLVAERLDDREVLMA